MKYGKFTISAILILGILTLIYFRYIDNSSHEIIILHAQYTKHRKKPLDPGGVEILNANSLIYEKLTSNDSVSKQINFNSLPEKPINIIFEDDEYSYDPIDKTIGNNPSQTTLTINTITENNKLHKVNINNSENNYKLQLTSAWSEKEAKNKWEKIKLRHIKYLKNSKLITKKIKTNDGKIIYLIMAGNYASLSQAKLICKKLIAKKQSCIVTK